MAKKETRHKDKIIVPIDKIVNNHMEFEVVEENDGSFTVVDHVAGVLNPNVFYTGFPSRKAAEKFVLAQPEPWE